MTYAITKQLLPYEAAKMIIKFQYFFPLIYCTPLFGRNSSLLIITAMKRLSIHELIKTIISLTMHLLSQD